MSSVAQGHGREREWMQRLHAEGRFACRPRWAVVDVLSMLVNAPTYFDEVKTDLAGPYDHFRPPRRKKLLALATQAGAEARLIWWPLHKDIPVVIPAEEWPT